MTRPSVFRLPASAIAAILAAAALATATLAAQRPVDLVNRQVAGEVVSVVDGDTVDVLIHPHRKVRVRLHGVDAPERTEPFSGQARSFTRGLMFSRTVTVIGRDVDPYDRLVARVVVDGVDGVDGTDASEAILTAGLACHFRRYSDDARLEAAEQTARAARRGFWAAGAPQPACVAREAQAASARPTRPVTPATTGFVGNENSRLYHAPSCANAGCRNCTRRFASRADAEAAGFRPAGDCLQRWNQVLN